MATFREDLAESLRDPEFAKQFGAAQAKSGFALTLARARRKAGLTQQELADRFGVSQSYVAKLEGGEANPTLGTIGSLLSVLGLRLSTDAIPLLVSPGDSSETTFDTTMHGEPLRDVDQKPRAASIVTMSLGCYLSFAGPMGAGVRLADKPHILWSNLSDSAIFVGGAGLTESHKNIEYKSLRDVDQQRTHTYLIGIPQD